MKNIIIFISCVSFFLSGFSQITSAEYYFDTDNLGVGNQNALTVTSGNSIDENFSIPTTGLQDGLHVLHIRVKGTNNVWSLYKRAYFYVQTPTTNYTAKNIVAAEYYFDTDNLGVGNQNALTISSSMAINENFSIPTTGLLDGLHTIQIRVKDDDNTWSLYKRAYFYVHSSNSNMSPTPIVAAEYFIGNNSGDDPGTGNANSLTVTQGMTLNETFTIPIPTTLTNGDYYLHIRVQDQNGTWSLYKRALFTVDNTVSVDEFNSDVFSVYPNPSNDKIFVDFKQKSDYIITLFDSTGKELFSINELKLHNQIDLSIFNTGLYFLKIKEIATNKVQNFKILKN